MVCAIIGLFTTGGGAKKQIAAAILVGDNVTAI